jgi:hypothetical protein
MMGTNKLNSGDQVPNDLHNLISEMRSANNQTKDSIYCLWVKIYRRSTLMQAKNKVYTLFLPKP